MFDWNELGEIKEVFVYFIPDEIKEREGWYWEAWEYPNDLVYEAHGPYDTYEEARDARLQYLSEHPERPSIEFSTNGA